MPRQPKFIVKRRRIQSYRNPFKRGGYDTCYGPWETIGSFGVIDEALASIDPRDEPTFDIGIFYRSKRIASMFDGVVRVEKEFNPFARSKKNGQEGKTEAERLA